MEFRISTFDSEAFCGYTQKTTFFEDFSIADNFGINAIKDTYKRAFKDWKSNCEYLTELVMVLNWKSWQWSEKNTKFCQLYIDLYQKTHNYALNNLKGEDLSYYLRTTD